MKKNITKVLIYPKDKHPDNPHYFIQNSDFNYRISTSFEYLNKKMGFKINIIRNIKDYQILDNKNFYNKFSLFQIIDDTEQSCLFNKDIDCNLINIFRYQDGEEILFFIEKIFKVKNKKYQKDRSFLYFGKEYSSFNKYLKYGYKE